MELPDLRERGRGPDGPIFGEDRLFVQLLRWTGCLDPAPVIDAVRDLGEPAAVYADLQDPRGVAVLGMSEDPEFFVTAFRDLARSGPFRDLIPLPRLTQFGRTYSLGHEGDLRHWLVTRPAEKMLDPANRWAVWYPLRRTGAFAALPAEEQAAILREHGHLGMAYGAANLAQDIRLACFGLDRDDNDFVIGLLGHDLHPLSRVVQAMRATRQTREYLDSLGPFFVGRVIHQTEVP